MPSGFERELIAPVLEDPAGAAIGKSGERKIAEALFDLFDFLFVVSLCPLSQIDEFGALLVALRELEDRAFRSCHFARDGLVKGGDEFRRAGLAAQQRCALALYQYVFFVPSASILRDRLTPFNLTRIVLFNPVVQCGAALGARLDWLAGHHDDLPVRVDFDARQLDAGPSRGLHHVFGPFNDGRLTRHSTNRSPGTFQNAGASSSGADYECEAAALRVRGGRFRYPGPTQSVESDAYCSHISRGVVSLQIIYLKVDEISGIEASSSAASLWRLQ